MDDNYKSLETQLTEAALDDHSAQTRQLMKKIWQFSVNSPRDETWHLLPGVLKLMASNDLLVKKLACWFLSQHANDENTVLLAINTLLKDSRDANPMIRGLALKTLTSLPHKHLMQYILPAVNQGLQDTSAYVRRIAVAAIPNLHKLSPSEVLDGDLLDKLYSLIRDNDPIVAVSCLTVLEVILTSEGGVVVNKNISIHLLNRLHVFTDWGLVTVFRLLCKFRPKSDDLTLDFMNLADEYLRHSNTAVAQQAFQYFLHLIVNMPHLQNQIHARTMESMLNKLNSGNHEVTFAVLEIIDNVLPTYSVLFIQKYKLFFCKYNEPVYLKRKRLQLLPRLVEKENEAAVMEELELYCHDSVPELCHKALEGLGHLSKRSKDLYQGCLAVFIKLLNMHVEHIILGVLQVLQDVPLQEEAQNEEIFTIIANINKQLTNSSDKSALFWLLGEHCNKIPNIPYIVEELVEDIETFSPDTCMSCLSATIKIFLSFPSQTQVILSQVIETCVKHKNQRVRERSLAYYSILKASPESAVIVLDQ